MVRSSSESPYVLLNGERKPLDSNRSDSFSIRSSRSRSSSGSPVYFEYLYFTPTFVFVGRGTPSSVSVGRGTPPYVSCNTSFCRTAAAILHRDPAQWRATTVGVALPRR